MGVGPVDGVVDKGLHRVGDGLDQEASGEDTDPDPVVRLQPLAKEGDGEQPAPDDWCTPEQISVF